MQELPAFLCGAEVPEHLIAPLYASSCSRTWRGSQSESPTSGYRYGNDQTVLSARRAGIRASDKPILVIYTRRIIEIRKADRAKGITASGARSDRIRRGTHKAVHYIIPCKGRAYEVITERWKSAY